MSDWSGGTIMQILDCKYIFLYLQFTYLKVFVFNEIWAAVS